MTVGEFVKLKKRLHCRAKEILACLGQDVAGEIHYHTRGDLMVIRIMDRFMVKLTMRNGKRMTIYSTRNGTEDPLGWNHKEVVRHYNRALQLIDQAMILEDLANA